MPIINHVPDLLAKKFGGADNVSIQRIAQEMGMPYGTVARWVRNKVTRVDSHVFDAWCAYLDCTGHDLLEYVETKNDSL